MKKAIPLSSFNSNATTKSALLFLLSSHASEFSKTIKMSLDKPDGFCFRWTDVHRRCVLQRDYQLCESLGKLEIHKPTLKKDLTPLDQLATTKMNTTTTIPDPPPLGPDPGRGPDFPGPPLPPPPIPDIPLKPPHKPPPKPPDEVPPPTPPQKVPPPEHPPGRRPLAQCHQMFN